MAATLKAHLSYVPPLCPACGNLMEQHDGTDAIKIFVDCPNQNCVYYATRFSFQAPTVELTKE